MVIENTPNEKTGVNEIHEQDIFQNKLQQSLNVTSKPTIAGILLIIAGILAILFGVLLYQINTSTIDISQFQDIDPDITSEQIKTFFTMCGTAFCILGIFPILGGILALKRKLWGITLVGGIIGLLSFGFFISSILSLIAIILLAISRKEFQ